MSRFGDLVGGKKAAPAPTPTPEPVVVEEVVGSPILGEDTTNYDEVIEEEFYESDVSLHDMTKRELEEYGRTVGIELDRRHSKKRLVKELEEYLDNH
ncbi:MAG: hypothetical protein VW270_20880 [Candidatus Poseidoniales archaeon]